MTRKKFTTDFLNHAATLFDGVRSLKSVAESLGVNPDNLSKFLRANNISFAVGRSAPNKMNDLPENEIVNLYTSGHSELDVSRKFNVSRNVIRRILIEHGVEVRNQSQANIVSAARATPDERKKRAKAANNSLRGTSYSNDKRIKRAISREKTGFSSYNIGIGENELYDLFSRLGFNPIKQKAVKFYNVDIVVGNVAVELKSGSANRGAFNSDVSNGRIKEIVKSGFNVVYVCFHDVNSLMLAADEVVSLVEKLNGNPPSIGKYWMIGSRTQDYIITRNDREQFTRVPAPIHLVTKVSMLDY